MSIRMTYTPTRLIKVFIRLVYMSIRLAYMVID